VGAQIQGQKNELLLWMGEDPKWDKYETIIE
jgi:hypothetical protein